MELSFLTLPLPSYRGVISHGSQNLIFFSQLTPSSEKKSIPELKTLLAVRPVLDSLLAFANGCICGGILGANETMVSSVSTLSLMLEVTLRCPDLDSPNLGVVTLVVAGTPTPSLSPLSSIIVHHYPISGGFWRPGLYPFYLFNFSGSPLHIDFFISFLLSPAPPPPVPLFSQMCYLLC
jgi:hypothetical protein